LVVFKILCGSFLQQKGEAKRKEPTQGQHIAVDIVTATVAQKRPRLSEASAKATVQEEASSSSSSAGPPPTQRAATIKDVVRANAGVPMTSKTPSAERVVTISRPVVQNITQSEAAVAPISGIQWKRNDKGRLVIDPESLLVDARSRDQSEFFTRTDEDANTDNKNFQRHRRKNRRQKWNQEQTEKFYEALRKHGTNFTLIAVLFPGRTRDQIRNKFKKEEKENGHLIDMALRQHVPISEEEQKFLADKAREIAEQDKLVREKRERGEITSTPTQQDGPPVRRPAVTAPVPEMEPESCTASVTEEATAAVLGKENEDDEVVLDRTAFQAQNRFSDNEDDNYDDHYGDLDDYDTGASYDHNDDDDDDY